MIVDELVTKFTHLLCDVPYLKDEKEKVQHFLKCFPVSFKERRKYNNSNNMDEVIRKA